MSATFKEPDWDDDVPDTKRIFKHKTPVLEEKTKKNKSVSNSENDEEQSNVGKFVRLRPDNDLTAKCDGFSESSSIAKKQKKKRKLKQEKVQNSNNVMPEPVLKKQKVGEQMNGGFADKLRANLKGSRFRYFNEQLYSREGRDAVKLFENDSEAFEAYHEGYRNQVENWPLNPLKRIIKAIMKSPKTEVVADFGCGEGLLAKSVPHKVFSLDLVALNEDIIACDMANTPLKSESVNIAVYCLSLMGTNLKDFILEANRVLKINGKLKIAEVESRFETKTINDFITNIELCGFKLLDKDLNTKLFYFLNFKKIKTIDKKQSNSIKNFSLKPCLYKKR